MATVERARLSRRGLFGLFGGALAAPVVAKLPMVASAPIVVAPVATGGLSLSEIVSFTMRNRSGVIAEHLVKNNALLDRLKTGALRSD